MEIFRINATVRSPFILLDPESGIMEISGRSLLDDSELFYKPMVEWIEEYIKSPSPKTTFICNFNYYNNPLSKILFNVLMKLDKNICPPNRFEIHWYYEKDDNDMLENGEGMTRFIKNGEIKFIEINHSLNKSI